MLIIGLTSFSQEITVVGEETGNPCEYEVTINGQNFTAYGQCCTVTTYSVQFVVLGVTVVPILIATTEEIICP